MTETLSRESLDAFRDFVGARLGLSFPVQRQDELVTKTAIAARTMGFEDVEAFVAKLLSDGIEPRRLEALTSSLTVGETFFYREQMSLLALERIVFPAIIGAHTGGAGQLRIWSAGCCTGEEPYSIAMMVSEQPAFRDWSVTIIGSDINQSFLSKAEAGIYTDWSFRGVPDRIRAEYFRKRGRSTYEVIPRIRRMVSFQHLNLVGDEYPTLFTNTNSMDLILCRNVLMYFRPEIIPLVMRKLARSLHDSGWLVVSPVESALVNDPDLAQVPFSATTLFRKHHASASPFPEPRPLQVTAIPRSRKARLARAPAPIPEAARRTAAFACARERFAAAEYDACIEILTDPAALLRTDPEAHELIARAHANAGRLSEAEVWCNQAIAADKLNPARYYLLATILIEQSRPDAAIAALKKTLYVDPGFVVAHFALGNAMLRRGKKQEARRQFANVLDLLRTRGPDEALPEADGLPAGRLSEIVQSLLSDGVGA